MSRDIAEWLAIAGAEKAASIARLAPPEVHNIVEIGCGTGAVLAALDRIGFGQHYWACEPAANLADQIDVDGITRLRDLERTTFDAAFHGRTFDLAVLSHVVEHLLAPADLIHQALHRARYVFIEVPIEQNFSGRVRMEFNRMRGRDQLTHSAGHVQFFSRRSTRLLVRYAGGELLNESGYFPRAPYAAQATRAHRRAVLAVSRCGPVARAYYEHFAVVAQRAQCPSWDHHYARPV